MAKPYSLFKKSSGIYYVQFPLENGARSNQKSTGTRIRSEAEKTAMHWFVNGEIPQRINGKKHKTIFLSSLFLTPYVRLILKNQKLKKSFKSSQKKNTFSLLCLSIRHRVNQSALFF